LAKRAGRVLAAAGIGAWKGADARAAANLLGRAASVLPAGEPKRAEILCELGMTLGQLGDSAAADAAFTQAIDESDAVGDDVSAAWSRIELARARLHRGGDPEELVALVQAATPLFEEAGNERALGRAWRALGYARGSLQGRCADWLDASDRARRYYRRSGWSNAGCLSETASALYHGPTPVPEALERCERLLEEATDRPGRAHVLAHLAGLHAYDERGDEAVRLLDEADIVYRDLQDDYSLANTSGRIRGRVHALAEDHEAAQTAFRACCETFERFDDSAALASVAAELGGSLFAHGRIEEARVWSALAERRAPAGDVIAQFSWRILKAKLLAGDNRLAEAEPLAGEALSLAMQTDALTSQGDVLLDVATVLTAAERPREAAERVRQAIDVYDRKQNVAAARNARARLAGAEVV
ncbi:MAG: hypothetical protein ACRDNH_00680, partial [Gaiellaceae bacterium]